MLLVKNGFVFILAQMYEQKKINQAFSMATLGKHSILIYC